MQFKFQQRALASVSWLLVIFLILIGIWLVIRVVPVYVEHYSVLNALQSLQSEPAMQREVVRSDAPTVIKDTLQKQFMIDNVTNATLNNVQLVLVSDGYVVRIIYEVRVSLVGNVYLLFHFDDSVKVRIL